jgi:hypothetical protein
LDVNERLDSHEDLLRHLIALVTRMDTYIERVTANLDMVTRLLQRREGLDEHNGR